MKSPIAHKRITCLLWLLAAIAFAAPVAFAQQTSGNLVGTVFDPAGATVPNAAVTVRNTDTGVENKTQTTSAGQFRFSNLPTGTYTLTTDAQGFSQGTTKGIIVPLNVTVTQNVTLQIGTASTVVEVAESGVAIDTTTQQLQTTFEAKQLADLPSASGGQNGTGVLNISLLAPNVTTSGGLGYGEGPSVGGQRPTNNNFMVEGIDNNSLAVTGPIVTVPNDAVAEFTMLQNQFSPDFGHSSGGQFNEVVKSGTNEFHGLLYEYFENKNLDAADNLNAVQGNPIHPRYDNNRFGGTFGGPIKRNKLFFFVNYEYNPVGQTASTFYYAPTASGYATLASLPYVNQTNLSVYQKYLGAASTASTLSAVTAGPTVTITNPSSLVNQSVAIPTGQVSSSLPNFFNDEYAVASIDYNISDKDSLRGRFILNRTGTIDTSGFPAAFFTTIPVNSYLATLSEFHTFAPNLTNEFRLGYNRQYQNYPVPTGPTYPGLDQFPNIVVYETDAAFGPDANAPQYTIQNLYQGTDNLSWSKGQHNLKFGTDIWNTVSPSKFIQRARGDYEYNTLDGFLTDQYPDNTGQRSTGNTGYYQNQQLYSFYGNDSWKVNPHLTINLGLRYEYMTIPLGEQLQSLNASANVPGLLTFSNPTTQKTNFMPRVGVAYSPGTGGKTSFRAGFGKYYDVVYQNLGSLSQPPQLSTTVTVTGNPGTGFLANGGIPPNASVATPEGAAAQAATSAYIPDQKRPEAYSWNVGIEHEFANKYVLESRYVGTRGLYLPVQTQLNVVPTVTAANALPVFTSMPSAALLSSLTNTEGALVAAANNGAFISPAFAAAGFTNPITSFSPIGNSIYHSWATELTRRFSNGLQFDVSYTWSHNIDDSTAAVDSTLISPRRPEDFTDLRQERASSILDHRNRIVAQVIYDVPYFKNSNNWFMKNLLGNWEVAPVYMYQSGQVATALSNVDTNLNQDAAGDRVIVNPTGRNSVGTDVTGYTAAGVAVTDPSSTDYANVVAFVANNPNARYVQAPVGTLATAGRNTLMMNPINDIDLTAVKRISINERFRFEISARAFNIFNHPQYVGGYVNDVYPQGFGEGSTSGVTLKPGLEPANSLFGQWSQVVSSNPRQLQLALKLSF